MRMLLTALLLLLLAAACDGDDRSGDGGATPFPTWMAPTSTMSATPPPGPSVRVEVTGPSASDTLRPGNLSFLVTYVMDMTSRRLYTIALTTVEGNAPVQRPAFTGWSVGGNLLFVVDEDAYEIALDGGIRAADIAAMATSEIPSSSADGAWRTMRTGEGLVVMNRDASVRYRLVGSELSLVWAPQGHLGAFATGACHGGELHVFDPARGVLEKMTQPGEFVLDWSWHPDGSQLAANFLATSSGLALLDVGAASWEFLVPLNGGELAPLGWSDDGSYLAFRYRGGRDFGCGEGDEEPPYVPPSVERIR